MSDPNIENVACMSCVYARTVQPTPQDKHLFGERAREKMFCHRYPPVPTTEAPHGKIPEVSPRFWCGEWKHKA